MSGKPLNDAIERVIDFIRRVQTDQRRMPATFLFNEGWMLRLILKAAESENLGEFIPQVGCRWFSEARLYTPFNEARGQYHEGFTNADAVVGDFDWTNNTKTGVQLADHPKRFEVFEAKMYAGLSKGVKAAPWFDQAARTVACMAYTLAQKNVSPDDPKIERIRFCVVAPVDRINAGVFAMQMTTKSIRAKVERRIQQFSGQGREELELWREEYFDPLLKRFETDAALRCISWGDLIAEIGDNSQRKAIQAFYDQCIEAAGRGSCDPLSQKPLRGRAYRIVDQPGHELVIICCPGEKTSRVFVPESDLESFTVANQRLQLAPDSIATCFSIPREGELRLYRGRQVVVKSKGPCRSEVAYPTSPANAILVENHFLKPLEAVG